MLGHFLGVSWSGVVVFFVCVFSGFVFQSGEKVYILVFMTFVCTKNCMVG